MVNVSLIIKFVQFVQKGRQKQPYAYTKHRKENGSNRKRKKHRTRDYSSGDSGFSWSDTGTGSDCGSDSGGDCGGVGGD